MRSFALGSFVVALGGAVFLTVVGVIPSSVPGRIVLAVVSLFFIVVVIGTGLSARRSASTPTVPSTVDLPRHLFGVTTQNIPAETPVVLDVETGIVTPNTSRKDFQ